MYTHNLNPVLFDFGLIAIKWYSLAYIVGILLGWWFGKKIVINKIEYLKFRFDIQEFDNLITYIIISIIVGGRIGYVLFYNLDYYISNPTDIIKKTDCKKTVIFGVLRGTHLVYNWAKQNKIDVYYIDRPYWGETRNHPYYVKIVKNNHLKYWKEVKKLSFHLCLHLHQMR